MTATCDLKVLRDGLSEVVRLLDDAHCLTVDRHVQVQGGSYCIILDRATISELGLKKGSKIHVNFLKVVE